MDTVDTEIREILFNIWDPLSVGTNMNLIDEYDDLIPAVRQRLRESEDKLDVERFLEELEKKLGDFDFNLDNAKLAADKLMHVRERYFLNL